jgi:chromosome segregation ATPase
MDFNNLELSEQEIAVQLFRVGLNTISKDLAEANSKYREAQEALKHIEASRNDIVAKYNTIISLISKAGGEISKEEANLVNLDSPSSSPSKVVLSSHKTYIKSIIDNITRPTIRSEVIEVLRASNKLQTAIEVLTTIRKTNPTIPDSTVTSALSVQFSAGNLNRYSANGTNLYGLPEWFSDGKPKEEYLENRQMSI